LTTRHVVSRLVTKSKYREHYSPPKGQPMIIKNKETLLSHGNIDGRRCVLDILEAGIAAADPYENTRKLLKLEGNILSVGNESSDAGIQVYNLKKIKHIYVVGGGKAVHSQAKAFEDVLGDHITEGHINIKKGEKVELSRIGVSLAGHPLPDRDSVDGGKKIYEILLKAGEGDLLFWLRSGGGTSLLSLPVEGVTLEDLVQVSRILYFGGGATMPEINVIRNLISVLGLKHAKYVHGAVLFEFLVDEIPGGMMGHDYMRSPGNVDPYQRAREICDKYGVWDKIPQSVRALILKADPKHLPPTKAELAMRPFHNYKVIDPHTMLAAAIKKARELGLNATILATSLNDVPAKSTGEILAEIARETELFGRPLSPPCVFICGGEVVVAVGQETGVGGRNQELVLSAATRIAGSKSIVIGSADSDGTDGPTNIAGGIVDGLTMERVREAGFDITEELRHHNTSPVLEALGDYIIIGNTGTNLRDLRVVYVGKP
jgi:glycerate 2-kinase